MLSSIYYLDKVPQLYIYYRDVYTKNASGQKKTKELCVSCLDVDSRDTTLEPGLGEGLFGKRLVTGSPTSWAKPK